MADNMDEFEREEFAAAELAPQANDGLRKRLVDAWRTQPLFKLMVIMIVVGVALAGALGVFSGPPSPDSSRLITAPKLDEPPGGKASSYFREHNEMANKERAEQAMQEGSSAMPTPVGQNFDIGDLTNKKKEDHLAEFRAETERLKQEINQERQRTDEQIRIIRDTQPTPSREDDTLAELMRKQMEQLMEAWAPRKMTVVEGPAAKEQEKEKKQDVQASVGANASAQTAATPAAAKGTESRILVQAGTVNYAQLMTEANSDVKGPIMAQIVSGPMAGGRALGQFKVMQDYLVLEFNLVNYKGKDYPVEILALDPNTTLGGMATEVDHRYFDRILLPAAAAFASQFGQTLGQGKSNVTVTDSAVVVDNASKSYKEALFSGMGQAGQSISQFLQQEAQQIKPLIRVAVGTPLGMFFLRSVHEEPEQNMTAGINPYAMPYAAGGGGYSQIPGYPGAAYPGSTYGYSDTSYAGGTGQYPAGTGYYPAGARPYGTATTNLPGTGVSILTPNQTGLVSPYTYGR